MQNLSQSVMDQIFALAQNGSNEVACLWNHLPESFLTTVTNAGNYIQSSAAKYPAVSFRYCTAVEAMQRWQDATNLPPPQLAVSAAAQGDTLTLNIGVNGPIFQAQPFVAVRDALQNYQLVACQPAASNTWTAVVPVPLSQIAKIGVAVTDPWGNLATNLLRYLPDDVYLDNLDPQYAEISGAWAPSSTFAWGLDARVATLASNSLARVQWSLPVVWTGHYNLFAQVPAVTNAATNLSFSITDEAANTVAQFALPALPAGQWVYLGSALLEASHTNTRAMTVSGSTQAGAHAVADVIKLAPVVAVPPVLTQPRLAGAVFSAALATQWGLDYTLEYKNSPADAEWTTVRTVTGNGGAVVLADPSANGATRFYRVRAQWH